MGVSKPAPGRTVTVKGPLSNGIDEHPAIITRCWSDAFPCDGQHVAINVTMFPDNGEPRCLTSVPMFASRDEALAKGHGWINVAFWPDRV